MKCYFHPNEESLYECAVCGKPICGDCMRFEEDEQVVCPACTLEAAVDYADEDVRSYMDKIHQLRTKKVAPKTINKTLESANGWLLLTILALIGVFLYLGYYIGQTGDPASFNAKRFAEGGDPAPEMTYIIAKIFAYANDHNNQYPETLDALFPDYLESKPRILNTEEQYIYSVINGPEGFILNLPRPDRYGYRKLYATAEGIIRGE